MRRTIAVHVHYKSLQISFPPLQNNNVKWLNFALSGECNDDGWFFKISMYNLTLSSEFSLERAWTARNKTMTSEYREILFKMQVHFFTDVVHDVAVVVSQTPSCYTLKVVWAELTSPHVIPVPVRVCSDASASSIGFTCLSPESVPTAALWVRFGYKSYEK